MAKRRKKELVVEAWSNEPLRLQKRDPFGIGVLESSVYPEGSLISTRLCPPIRHRKCSAKRYWDGEGHVKGICGKAVPTCGDAKDKLAKELGLPEMIDNDGERDAVKEAYHRRSRAFANFFHECFGKCRELTVTVKEG